MIRVVKEVRIYSVWFHMESLTLDLPEQDEKAFLSAAQAESKITAGRSSSKWVDMEAKFWKPQEIIDLHDKKLLRFRAAVGPRFFDSALGDWPFDKADVFGDAEAAKDLEAELGIGGISMFLWKC